MASSDRYGRARPGRIFSLVWLRFSFLQKALASALKFASPKRKKEVCSGTRGFWPGWRGIQPGHTARSSPYSGPVSKSRRTDRVELERTGVRSSSMCDVSPEVLRCGAVGHSVQHCAWAAIRPWVPLSPRHQSLDSERGRQSRLAECFEPCAQAECFDPGRI